MRFLIAVAGALLLSWLAGPAAAQSAPCPPSPYLQLTGTDSALLLRCLARTVAMNGLTDELVPQPVSWNRSQSGQLCYPNDAVAASRPYDDSLSCAGLCRYVYCPRNFAADVALLVRLRATFVQSAAGSWELPERFLPGSTYLAAAGQTVADLNAAFDCAGLARPYVQASVFENVDPNQSCDPPTVPCQPWMKPGPPGTNSGTNVVPIPTAVIEEFRDELSASSADSAYYLDAAGRPRTGLHFNFFRLAYLFWQGAYSPDATKLEGRMWLYYQAICYLDLGYTSLHLGQPKVWARLVGQSGRGRQQTFQLMARLLGRIRSYAARRPGLPPLLLTAEPLPNGNGSNDIVPFANGTDSLGRARLLFDFNLAAMRPRETSPQLDEQANPHPAGFRCPAIDPQALRGTACAGQSLATIDPCHGFNFGPDGGGISPLGLAFTQTPYVIYFDHGPTIQRRPDGRLAQPDSLWAGNEGTWGWDDSAWFSKGLTDSCQAAWLRYELGHVQNFANSRGFLVLPGRLYNNLSAGQPAHPEWGVPDYRLAAHPVVAAAAEQAWQPQLARPVLVVAPGQGVRLGRAAGGLLHRRWLQLPAWTLHVENPDLTSLYTWQVRGPGGIQTGLHGKEVLYLPPVAGTYSIELRQDNLGLSEFNGSRVIVLPGLPPAATELVDRSTARRGRQAVSHAQPLIP